MPEDYEIDADKAVAKATSEDEFDALSFFSHASLPETSITLHQDTAAAYRLNEIRTTEKEQAEKEKTEGLSIADDIEFVDQDEVTELQDRLTASAVTFKIKAIAPSARTAIERKARASNPYTEGEDNTEYNDDLNANLIAKSIVSVKNAAGRLDKKAWTGARVKTLTENLEPSEYSKLFAGVFRVNFVGDAVDRAVNADF